MSSSKVYLIRHKRSLRYYNGKRERWWGDLSQAKIYPRIGIAKTAITCHTKKVHMGKWWPEDVELVEAELRVMEND